jgi:hypothetical protein
VSKDQLPVRPDSVFPPAAAVSEPPVDAKTLYSTIAELALESDSWDARSRPASAALDETSLHERRPMPGMDLVAPAIIQRPAACIGTHTPFRVLAAGRQAALTMRTGFAPITARGLPLTHLVAPRSTGLAATRCAAGPLNVAMPTSSHDLAPRKTRDLSSSPASLTISLG